MTDCVAVPTRTLFGTSEVEQTETTTTTVTTTSTLPDSTTTLLITTSTCTPVTFSLGLTSFSIGSSCLPITTSSTSVIDGGVTVIVEPSQVVLTVSSPTTFPTATEFSQSCTTPPVTTSSSTTTTSSAVSTSTATSSTEVSSTSTSLITSADDRSSITSSFTLSTPPPTTVMALTNITSGTSVFQSTVLSVSQPPPSTIFNSPQYKGKSSTSASGSMIGGIVGGVVGFLVILGVGLWLYRSRKSKKELEEQLEYENHVKGEFGRRLALEFDDDDDSGLQTPRNKTGMDGFYSDDPAQSAAGRPMSMAESTPMLASSARPQHHRPGSSSSSARTSQHVRFSTLSASHSLYGHQPLATDENGYVSPVPPPLPTTRSMASASSYNHGGASHRYGSSGSGSLSQHQRPQSSRSSSDMLINFDNPGQLPRSQNQTPMPPIPFSDPRHSPQTSNDSNIPSNSMNNRQSYATMTTTPGTRPSTADSLTVLQPPPTAPSQGSLHAHKRSISSAGSSIMSALMSVTPLQTLKIANRTKLDELEDEEDEDGDDGSAHAMQERNTSTKDERGGVS